MFCREKLYSHGGTDIVFDISGNFFEMADGNFWGISIGVVVDQGALQDIKITC